MSKYTVLKFWKKTKARVNHGCYDCKRDIFVDEIYFVEELKNRFLHSLHRKKLCDNCYSKVKVVTETTFGKGN